MKIFDQIDSKLQKFIEKQQMFFVATAPLSADGHVNLSPKGLDCLRVLSPTEVAYLDMTGSGNETSAHITENGRITFMFCAFKGSPNIVRLYGQGTTVLPDTAEWERLRPQFRSYTGVRQIIHAQIHRVSTSCGYAVPLFEYVGQRDTLVEYWEAKGEDALPAYQEKNNLESIDCIVTALGQRAGRG
jgi:hypothetical protein